MSKLHAGMSVKLPQLLPVACAGGRYAAHLALQGWRRWLVWALFEQTQAYNTWHNWLFPSDAACLCLGSYDVTALFINHLDASSSQDCWPQTVCAPEAGPVQAPLVHAVVCCSIVVEHLALWNFMHAWPEDLHISHEE